MRAYYREGLSGVTLAGLLVPFAGASVYVYREGTELKIAETIYATSSGVGTLPNPLTSDSSGMIEFFLALQQRVDLYITKPGFVARRITVDVSRPPSSRAISVTEAQGGVAGAKGDGSDATAALLANVAALDGAGGGTLIIPKGFYPYTTGLVVSPSAVFQAINIMGEGMFTSHLQWAGATDGIALRVNGLKNYIFEGFAVETLVAKGTTIGVRVFRDGGTPGTTSGSCSWRNVAVGGFATGVRVGDVGTDNAASEFLLDHLKIVANDVGFQIEAANSLDFLFNMLENSGNGTGVKVISGGSVTVNGGSASVNTVADFDYAPAGNFTITGFRTEGPNRFLKGGNTTSGLCLTVEGCTVHAGTNPDSILIETGSGPVTLLGNDILGKIQVGSSAWCTAVAIGNAIGDTQVFRFSGSGGRYVQFGNKQVTNPDNLFVAMFPDEVGYVASSVGVPSWRIGALGAPQILACTTATRPAAASVPGALIHVTDASAGSKFQGSDGSAWVSLG